MAWLLFKILDWFDKGPQPTDGMVGKIKKERDSERVDIYGRIRDDSHTPITKDANDEIDRYPSDEHESKKNSG